MCSAILGFLPALADMYYTALKDPNMPGAAGVIGSIGGFFASILLWFGNAYFSYATEKGGGDFSSSVEFYIYVGSGAVAGGLIAIIWGLRYDRLSIKPVGQGVVGGGIGAVIGYVTIVVIFFILLMMGG